MCGLVEATRGAVPHEGKWSPQEELPFALEAAGFGLFFSLPLKGRLRDIRQSPPLSGLPNTQTPLPVTPIEIYACSSRWHSPTGVLSVGLASGFCSYLRETPAALWDPLPFLWVQMASSPETHCRTLPCSLLPTLVAPVHHPRPSNVQVHLVGAGIRIQRVPTPSAARVWRQSGESGQRWERMLCPGTC